MHCALVAAGFRHLEPGRMTMPPGALVSLQSLREKPLRT